MSREKQLRAASGSHEDAATILESPRGFFQREENALTVRVEDPVVVRFAALRQRFDEDVGGVGGDDVETANRSLRFVEEARHFAQSRQVLSDGNGFASGINDGLHDFICPRVVLQKANHNGSSV